MEGHVEPRLGQDAWTVTDVYLLTETADGTVAVPNLALRFNAEGIELHKADGAVAWHCRWDELDEMSPVERSVLPDGRKGVAIVVVESNVVGGVAERFRATANWTTKSACTSALDGSSRRCRRMEVVAPKGSDPKARNG